MPPRARRPDDDTGKDRSLLVRMPAIIPPRKDVVVVVVAAAAASVQGHNDILVLTVPQPCQEQAVERDVPLRGRCCRCGRKRSESFVDLVADMLTDGDDQLAVFKVVGRLLRSVTTCGWNDTDCRR